ncbi:MAG: ParM/StbA family protein [Lachnospiraceae bacterium]|nr:ParM/StbA family protein [Lachnospiraceae bacterium]
MGTIHEYNINGTLILGVDAGYGNYKTAHCTFQTGLTKSAEPPAFSGDYLEYDGGYYIFGEGHKDFVAEKQTDEDNYILTLAAIVKELEKRGVTTARIHLAVGLPLKWVQAQRESFRMYMIQKPHVELKYRGRRYVVDIADCTVVPQCYAAIAENLRAFQGLYMIADIGNGTMNLMILNNGRVSERKSWTVRMGVHQCFMKIQNSVMDRTGERLPEEIIENYLRSGKTEIDEKYAVPMREAAKVYVDQIFAEMRDHDYNPALMKLYVMGGGARIVETVGEYDAERVTFDHDIRANAKGYEYFCYMKLRSQREGR